VGLLFPALTPATMLDEDLHRRTLLRTVPATALGLVGVAGTGQVTASDTDGERTDDDGGEPAVPVASSESFEQVAKLAPDDGDTEDRFGLPVAVSDDGATAIVGAPNDEDPAGSVYVFEESGSEDDPVARADADGDGAIDRGELREFIVAWSIGG